MLAMTSYTPRRVPGVRAKSWVIIRAENECGRDSSCLTAKWRPILVPWPRRPPEQAAPATDQSGRRAEPIQQRKVDQLPHARLLPVARATPARHPRAAARFLRQHLPRDPTAKDKGDAGEASSIRDARPSSFRSSWRNRQERFNQIPQCIRKQRGAHSRPQYRAARGPILLALCDRERFCYTL
jgi:hypothetical protein